LKKPLHCISLAVLALSAALPLAAQAGGRPDLVADSLRDAARTYVAGEMLVQFRAGVSPDRQQAALGRVQGKLVQLLRKGGGDAGELHRVKFASPLAMAAVLRLMQDHEAVDFAEPNWIYTKQVVSDDTYFTNGTLWGMYGANTSPANQYGSGAAVAWAADKTCSTDVVVGVIDEGAQWFHKDLRGQYPKNAFDAKDGADNDGNGYTDDVYGWDWDGNNAGTYDGTADDHGTHVSGTIGAKGGNGTGVVGVCWNISLINGKFLGAGGGTTANGILAIDYMTDRKTRHDINLVATSNSWGGGGFSQGMQDAITRAERAEILFIAAAGNNSGNNDTSPFYPASYPNANIISVAAIDSNGGLASFSNYGATTVDLGAPGVGVMSTVPSSKFGSGYASYSGTSMATPHVSGAAALYASLHPGSTAAQIKAAILAAATPTASLAGKTVTGGRLNVSGF
jgi:subtilisin family serine protease